MEGCSREHRWYVVYRNARLPLTRADDIKNMFEVNTIGPFYLARALVRSWLSLSIDVSAPSDSIDVVNMKGANLGKQLLFVSSVSGMAAMTPQRQTAYNASKGALTMMAKVAPSVA